MTSGLFLEITLDIKSKKHKNKSSQRLLLNFENNWKVDEMQI